MTYCYSYPRPMVTVDMVVIASSHPRSVLLIQRKNEPFAGKWALPGGFVDMDEPLEKAASRELLEETGLSLANLEQFKAYGDVYRDPRGRNIAVVFYSIIPEEKAVTGSDDAAEARWFDVTDLPELAFDHNRIITDLLLKI
ncbi:MAG: NUDIX hydrolase [Bacteroidales bacterium]|nr:NUDIX hydrolase [Bacteroidales bacterium]HQP05182.1 NUDIX hydrolase [Bacteroidales bacterium]